MRAALTDDKVNELNWRGPFTGMGSWFRECERAGFLDFQVWRDPALASANAILAAVTDNGTARVLTSGFAQPDVPRILTATAGGTAADVKAIRVIIEGTDAANSPISESLPPFTVDATGLVTSTKAFKTITRITIPAHDGLGATTAIGYADQLGLKKILYGNTMLFALADGVREATLPTLVTDQTEVAKNTIDPVTALNGVRDFVLVWVDMRRGDLYV